MMEEENRELREENAKLRAALSEKELTVSNSGYELLATSDIDFLTLRGFAYLLNKKLRTVETALYRKRKRDEGCYIPVETCRRDEPKYIYRVRDVLHVFT
jgi:hypothetical protein